MHSLNHPALGNATATARVDAARGRMKSGRHQHPPPLRSRVAFAAARVARRLVSAAARRAVA
jgi:hypothetical protein